MLQFSFSIYDLINVLFIAGGIGICGLCFLQITSSIHLRKEVRRYFQVFFLLILFYITSHLIRQILNGLPGDVIRTLLYGITFAEILAAGFTTHIMSLLVLSVAKLDKKSTGRLLILFYVILAAHLGIIIFGLSTQSIYYFDADNLYHRAPLYLLSNLAPVLMMLVDTVLLIQNRKKIEFRVKVSLWNYIAAPAAAVLLQSFSPKIQFIIFAVVGASVYLFAVIIQNQNAEYEKQKIESSRIDTELSMASAIQADMLPNIYPAFPDRPEFDVYASMDPAKEVGGDFYDFFLIDDDHLCMVMADVSGKGVPAALFMMASKIILANNAMIGKSPAQILTDTNAAICSNNREEMFVTVWLGILEISTGKLTAANAGHEYPVLMQPSGQFEIVKDKHGFVIGGMSGMKYKEYELQLLPGAKLFLYTDGVPEATNAEKELFGVERMLETLNQNKGASPEELLKNMRISVDGFVKDAEQFDDLTMLALEYKGE